jgi:hypothetical protein
VYLITLGEGKSYWEKYGHNALLFRDPTTGLDAAFNWGTFRFADPGLMLRILVNNAQYWVEAVPGEWFIEAYKQFDRDIVLQRLNLTPQQAARALAFAQWNALEQNKYYRYDYFRDNCSTRIRDVIDPPSAGS